MAADLHIACALSPEALRVRREGLLTDVLRLAQRRDLIESGLRLQFAAGGDTLSAISRAVDAERQCRILRSAISVEPDGGPMFLELTGPPGTREFFAALVDL